MTEYEARCLAAFEREETELLAKLLREARRSNRKDRTLQQLLAPALGGTRLAMGGDVLNRQRLSGGVALDTSFRL